MNRGPGWWGDPYRHSLAARGISSRFRMSDEAKASYPSLSPEIFENIKPVKGEIMALKDLNDLMDVFDRRKYIHRVPMGPQEAGAVMDMIRNFKNKVGPDDLDYSASTYDMIEKNVWDYKNTGNTTYLLTAVDNILFILHNSSSALLKFIGRPTVYTQNDEHWFAWHITHTAMNLQRGFYGSSATEVGEGQDLLEWWIEELERRRYT